MNPDYAIIGRAIEALRGAGSWCGETHIQKTLYVAKTVFGVPFSATFVLYKHGPYSFSLTGLLTSMRADRVIKMVSQGHQYGPSFDLEDRIKPVMVRYGQLLKEANDGIERAAKFLGPKNVAELERLATAIYVWQKNGNRKESQRAEELNRLKPHISLDAALSAVTDADRFLRESSVFA